MDPNTNRELFVNFEKFVKFKTSLKIEVEKVRTEIFSINSFHGYKFMVRIGKRFEHLQGRP